MKKEDRQAIDKLAFQAQWMEEKERVRKMERIEEERARAEIAEFIRPEPETPVPRVKTEIPAEFIWPEPEDEEEIPDLLVPSSQVEDDDFFSSDDRTEPLGAPNDGYPEGFWPTGGPPHPSLALDQSDPRAEVGARVFLKRNPELRGTVIALSRFEPNHVIVECEHKQMVDYDEEHSSLYRLLIDSLELIEEESVEVTLSLTHAELESVSDFRCEIPDCRDPSCRVMAKLSKKVREIRGSDWYDR